MRKIEPCLIVMLTALSLGLTLVPGAYSQTESIQILSYSWYVDSLGYLVVVGEVQNTGSNTIDRVILSGIVYTKDGVSQSSSYAYVWVTHLIPQQRAPFYMEFTSASSDTSMIDWFSMEIDHVDFSVNVAEETASYQYQDLTITSSSATLTEEGIYWVSGIIQNMGTQTAKNIRVVATFYNSSGIVVAAGYTDPLTPASLVPSATASFKVGAFDQNETEVSTSRLISSYSLLIQTEEPILSGTAPSVVPTSSPAPTTSPTNSSSPTPSEDSNPSTSLAPELVYAILVAIVILGLSGAILVLRKRKSQTE